MGHVVPNTLRYSKTHEWIKEEPPVATVGITDFAQAQLGEIVFIELPEVGRKVRIKEACAVIESVKAASDIYAPVSGVITAINTELNNSTEPVNNDPYGKGWLFKIKIENHDEIKQLLSAEEYISRTEKK